MSYHDQFYLLTTILLGDALTDLSGHCAVMKVKIIFLMRTSSSLSTCTVVSELLSIAPWPPARTESEATVDRPPSLQSGRTAGEPADTGWKEPAGRRSAGRKYFG